LSAHTAIGPKAKTRGRMTNVKIALYPLAAPQSTQPPHAEDSHQRSEY
jgi:hypothetical protein